MDLCFTCKDELDYIPVEDIPALCEGCQDDLDYFVTREAYYLNNPTLKG